MKALLVSTPFLPVSPDLKYGGSERIVYLLDQGLVKLGYSAGVVATADSKPISKLYPTIKKEVGVATILDKSQQEEWEGLYLRFEHISLSIKYSNEISGTNVVHLHDDNILIFDHLIKLPTLLTLHGDINGFWDSSITPSIKNCKTKLVSISQSQKRIYEGRGYKIDYVVYNGVDEDLFALSDKKYAYLLTLGGIMPVKGQDQAIKVGLKKGIDIIIAGNIGDQKYFNEKVKPNITHDLTEKEDKLAAYLALPKTAAPKIVYVGQVNDKQKKPLYSSAQAFLMPIDWEEPFGLVMVEAMLSGTPVIAYRRGSVPEIIAPDKTGIIVSSLEEMIEAISKVSKIEPRACREFAIKQFGKDQMVKSYIKVYKDILKSNK